MDWIGVKKYSNIQLLHTYHSLGVVKYQATENRPAIADIRLQVEKDILEKGDCVISTSPQEAQTLRTMVSQLGNIEIIPCGTDTENFHLMSKIETRQKLGLNIDDKIVLYVGRFDPRKGIETAVRACASIKSENFKLVLVGGSSDNRLDGAERARIEKIVEEVGIKDRTIFAGQIGHDLLPYYYAAADVCVVPSHYEPFGLVAIEAMGCGTPVVASDVGGLKFTVVPEETGLLVPPKDTQAFASAISRILFDDLWLKKLSKQARINVDRRFSWTGVGIQLSDLYSRLLTQSKTPQPLRTSKVPNTRKAPLPATASLAKTAV